MADPLGATLTSTQWNQRRAFVHVHPSLSSVHTPSSICQGNLIDHSYRKKYSENDRVLLILDSVHAPLEYRNLGFWRDTSKRGAGPRWCTISPKWFCAELFSCLGYPSLERMHVLRDLPNLCIQGQKRIRIAQAHNNYNLPSTLRSKCRPWYPRVGQESPLELASIADALDDHHSHAEDSNMLVQSRQVEH